MSPSPAAALAAVLVVAASSAAGQPAEPFVGAHGAMTPATYVGDHAGAAWRLDLWPGQGFHLVRAAPGGGAPEAEAGRWRAEAGAIVLATEGGPLALEVRNAQRLRPEGAPEDASGDLVTEGALDPAPVSLPAAGMLTYLADAAVFEHCATGLTHPVALEGDWLAAERAYLADRPGPGEPLYVTLDATIAMGEPMEGPARPMLTVDRFGATWPGEDCAGATAAPTLAGTLWRVRALGGEALDWAPPRNEPHLALRRDEARFTASAGCNTMRGGYVAEGDRLSFSAVASTLMACPDEMAATEAALAAALQATAAQAIGGRTLRLLGADGATLAEFEAVYLPR